MYKLDYGEFYITNVCNLNCQNCNRFNNYAFSGHHKWQPHAEQYRKWSEILEFDTLGIIGGEPLLNPEFPIWLENIINLWPNSKIRIITNGTQMSRWPDLYKQIEKHKDRVLLDISIHGFDLREEIMKNVLSFLKGPIKKEFVKNDHVLSLWKKSYAEIKDESWPECNTPAEFDSLPVHIQEECIRDHSFSRSQWEITVYETLYTDTNGVKAEVRMSNYFNESSVIFNDGKLRLQNSDPEKAISVCYSKKCHHFIDGKLYKCGPVGLLPEFIKQFSVDVSDKDIDLMNSYVPASLDWQESELTQFIDDLINEKVTPQCKFCPEKMEPIKFEAGYKKIKIVKHKQ